MLEGDHQADGRRDADGGCATHSEGANGVDHLVERDEVPHHLGAGEVSLIENAEGATVSGPSDNKEGGHGPNVAGRRVDASAAW
jgi:hypothetical protein